MILLTTLTQGQISITPVPNDGSTALMHASQRGHVEVVQALLAHGADANWVSGFSTARSLATVQAPQGGAGLPGYSMTGAQQRIPRYYRIIGMLHQAELLDNVPFRALVSFFFPQGGRPALPAELVLYLASLISPDLFNLLNSPNDLDSNGETRLMRATRIGSFLLARFWSLFDGNILVRNNDGQKALAIAQQREREEDGPMALAYRRIADMLHLTEQLSYDSSRIVARPRGG
jgi:ankyrin repeat protein